LLLAHRLFPPRSLPLGNVVPGPVTWNGFANMLHQMPVGNLEGAF